MPTGRLLTNPAGIDIAGKPARLTDTVYMSDKYMYQCVRTSVKFIFDVVSVSYWIISKSQQQGHHE